MSNLDQLSKLKALGDQHRSNPLSTFSSETLKKELERRGFWVYDMTLQDLDLNFNLLPLDLEL